MNKKNCTISNTSNKDQEILNLKNELKQLRKKLEYSEMENAVLKKLDSLVQERVEQQTRKK